MMDPMGDAASANRPRGNEDGTLYTEEAPPLFSDCESGWNGEGSAILQREESHHIDRCHKR